MEIEKNIPLYDFKAGPFSVATNEIPSKLNCQALAYLAQKEIYGHDLNPEDAYSSSFYAVSNNEIEIVLPREFTPSLKPYLEPGVIVLTDNKKKFEPNSEQWKKSLHVIIALGSTKQMHDDLVYERTLDFLDQLGLDKSLPSNDPDCQFLLDTSHKRGFPGVMQLEDIDLRDVAAVRKIGHGLYRF